MLFYYKLKYRIIIRHLSDSGLNPIAFGILILGIFIATSQYLISKTPYTHYIYAIIPIVLTSILSEEKRNTFLKSCFRNRQYYYIRIIENTIIGFPFVALLLINGKFSSALMVLIINWLLVLFKNRRRFSNVVPTPFYKLPFEFLVGFRKTFLLIFIIYGLGGIGIAVGNFNLGIFTLIVLQLICISFYLQPERYFYVWCHSMTSSEFLLHKCKILIVYTILLSSPMLISLLIAFNDRYLAIIAVQIVGMSSVIASALSKYAYFPRTLPLPEFVIFVLILIFVPSVLICWPYLYVKSRRSLKKVLE